MKSFIALSVLLSAFVLTSVASAEVKIGVVDVQKAIQGIKAGKDAKKQLETEVAKKRDDLQKKEAELKKKGDELKQKAAVLSEAQLKEQQAAFQREMMQFQQSVGQTQASLQQKEQELLKPVIEKMDKIIKDLASKGKYTVILQKGQNNVIWAANNVDITDDVIKAYDKK